MTPEKEKEIRYWVQHRTNTGMWPDDPAKALLEAYDASQEVLRKARKAVALASEYVSFMSDEDRGIIDDASVALAEEV